MRGYGWLVGGVMAVFLASCDDAPATGAGEESDENVESEVPPETPREPAISEGPDGVAILMMEGTPPATIRVAANPPEPPHGVTQLGSTYEILPPEGLPAEAARFMIRLPVPGSDEPAPPRDLNVPGPQDRLPEVPEDSAPPDFRKSRFAPSPERVLYIGLYDGTEWELKAARVVDGMAYAEFDHFSRATLLEAPPPSSSPQDPADPALTFSYGIWGLHVESDRAYVVLDISGAHQAVLINAGVFTTYTIRSLRAYATPPQPVGPAVNRFHMPSHLVTAMRPYVLSGSEVPIDSSRNLVRVPLDINPSEGMELSPDHTVMNNYVWFFSLAPIYENGVEGRQGRTLEVPVGVAQAYVLLRRGMLHRLAQSDRALADRFDTVTIRTPFHVFLDPYIGAESYGAPSGAEWLFSAMVQDATFPFIGVKSDSDYERVIAHEWGHYAVHMLYGDAAFDRLGSAKHNGWEEARDRSTAWSEDMATFLGQMGADQGYPAGAGPMRGDLEGYSRHPIGSGSDRPVSERWPNNRRMDASRVEAIGASILARTSGRFGFGRVCGFLADQTPMTVVEFLTKWHEFARNTAELAELQRIYVDERVVWRLRGRVFAEPEGGGEPAPVENPRVRFLSLTGEPLPYLDDLLDEAVSSGDIIGEEDSRFRLCVPPGPLRLAISGEGLREQTFDFSADTEPSTRTAPDETRFTLRRSSGYRLTEVRPVAATVATGRLVARIEGRSIVIDAVPADRTAEGQPVFHGYRVVMDCEMPETGPAAETFTFRIVPRVERVQTGVGTVTDLDRALGTRTNPAWLGLDVQAGPQEGGADQIQIIRQQLDPFGEPELADAYGWTLTTGRRFNGNYPTVVMLNPTTGEPCGTIGTYEISPQYFQPAPERFVVAVRVSAHTGSNTYLGESEVRAGIDFEYRRD